MNNKFAFLEFKYPDARINSHYDSVTGKVVIDLWEHPTIPKPNAAQMAKALAEYNQDRATRGAQRRVRKQNILQKMGLTVNDIPALLELLDDRNTD